MDKAAKVIAEAGNNELTYARTHKDTDVRLTSTRSGVKEELILASTAAPDRFVFPLRLRGLTASIDAGGNVIYKDAAGVEQARTPHGYMFDSKVDPLSDEPARSTGVNFALIPHGTGIALEVTLDRAWLNSPERQFPITVDPEITRGAWSDDTYVMNPFINNYSTETELKVGTFNGGGNKARSFMHFDTGNLPAGITYAQLQMRESHSYHCATDPQKIHRVTNNGWAGSTLTSYPGAAIDGWVTHGGWEAGSGTCGNRLALWNVTGDVQGWRNSGTTNGSFAAVAGNESDSYQWKKYRSYQAGDGPMLKIFSGNGPRLPSALQPPSMLPAKGPALTVSARYDHPLGYAGQLAFGLWDGYGVMVWNQWSPWTSSGVQRAMTTSALPVNTWYELRVAAYDGATYSDFTPPGHWIFNNTWAPETPTQITPAPNATVGQSFTASARYADHWGFAGELEFRAFNQAGQLAGTFRSPQPVQYGQIGNVNIANLPVGNYNLHAYSHSVGLFSSPSAAIPITVATQPGAPANVAATGMAEMAQVNWNAPSTGGSPVTAIRVTAQNQSGGSSKTVECQGSCLSSSTATIQQLVGGDSYKFIVEALNVMGTGQPSTPSANTPIQSGSILTPTAVTATAVDGGADITWTAPAVGGVLPLVTGYTVKTYRASDGVLIGTPKTSATTSATITNLPNATPVYFKVIATTLFIVASPESAQSNTVSPFGVPFAPAKPSATIVGEEATVSWSPPAPRDGIPGDNGSAITGYTVNIYRETTQAIVRSEAVGASITQLAVNGLMNGTPYFFTVQASNQSGISDHSPRSDSGSFAGKPFEPVNVQATGGPRRVTVRWEPPPPRGEIPGDNGAPITEYTVEVSPVCSQCSGLVTEGVVTSIIGLSPATTYSFQVFSINAQGRSNGSSTVQATTEIEPPGAPTLISAKKGDRETTLTWSPPSQLNGSVIEGYLVKVSPQCEPDCLGLVIDDPSQRTTTITGLVNDLIPYEVSLVAMTAQGPGSESDSLTVIPHRPTYVALGDSFSSGHGAPMDQEPRWDLSDECVRSSRAYAPVFAAASGTYGPEDLQFLACSGDVISGIRGQMAAIQGFPDLITITAGGNNADFAQILFDCFVYLNCENRYPDQMQKITNLKSDLKTLYEEVKVEADAAESQVFVFAYPQLFSSLETPCGGDFAFGRDERIFIRQLVSHMNDMIREAAQLAGIEVIELSGTAPDGLETTQPRSFDGKEICSASNEEWINGHSDDGKVKFHPNALGHQEMARILMERWLAGQQ